MYWTKLEPTLETFSQRFNKDYIEEYIGPNYFCDFKLPKMDDETQKLARLKLLRCDTNAIITYGMPLRDLDYEVDSETAPGLNERVKGQPTPQKPQEQELNKDSDVEQARPRNDQGEGSLGSRINEEKLFDLFERELTRGNDQEREALNVKELMMEPDKLTESLKEWLAVTETLSGVGPGRHAAAVDRVCERGDWVSPVAASVLCTAINGLAPAQEVAAPPKKAVRGAAVTNDNTTTQQASGTATAAGAAVMQFVCSGQLESPSDACSRTVAEDRITPEPLGWADREAVNIAHKEAREKKAARRQQKR